MNRDTCGQCGAPSELCECAGSGEEDLNTGYELAGVIDGTYAGRWMLAAFAENASSAWPDGTAVYVRRIKE